VHDHHHDDAISSYFTEQLVTLLVAGLFGFVAIQMYRTGMLNNLLAPQFHSWVLAGGVMILGLVVVRAIVIWREAGEIQAMGEHAHVHVHDGHLHIHSHAHPHVHQLRDSNLANDNLRDSNLPNDNPASQTGATPSIADAKSTADSHTQVESTAQTNSSNENDLDEGSEDDEHGHSHSHDLSWVMARMLVLVFPVALYFLGLPNATYSKERQLRMLGQESAMGAELLQQLAQEAEVVEEKQLSDGRIERMLQTKTGLRLREIRQADGSQPQLEILGGEGRRMRFNDLNDAAFDPAKRESLQGQTAILEGRFRRLGDKEFTLFRLKLTCCAADTVPLRVRIVVPQALSGFNDFDWVEVKGQIQFVKVPNQERYLPVILVADITDVRKTEPKGEYEL
jgi:uncharacterized membrane protein YcgQ (UPF0703/DUF1980 family)